MDAENNNADGYIFGDRSQHILEVQQIVIWCQRTRVLQVPDCEEHFSVKFCRPCCTSSATCSSNLLKQIQVRMVSLFSVNYHKWNKHKLFGMAEGKSLQERVCCKLKRQSCSWSCRKSAGLYLVLEMEITSQPTISVKLIPYDSVQWKENPNKQNNRYWRMKLLL